MIINIKDLLNAFEWCVVGYCDASILTKKEPEIDIAMTGRVVPEKFDSLRRKALSTNSLEDWLKLRKAIRQEIIEKMKEKPYDPKW